MIGRIVFFFASTAVMFGLLVLLNAQHLGANASLHWDASTCILTNDPMPSREVLAENRRHIYDIAAASGSNDPQEITRYFQQPGSNHVPLETVRRYYSQISYALARGAFDLGAKLTHSPTGAVVFFQLESALAMAASLALLLTNAVFDTRIRDRFSIFMIGLTFVTISSQPIFLSLSRQMLTETAGFMLLVPGVLLFGSAMAMTRRTTLAMALASLSALCLFLAVRARYTLGPTEIVLLPLVLLLNVSLPSLLHRWKHYALVAFAGIATTVALVVIDIHQYGPLILPAVYDQVLVRSSVLYFHTEPPYEPFFVMLFVNGPLLIIPAAGIGCWLISPKVKTNSQNRLVAVYTAVALLALIVPLVLMARQQISFQPRHMFAFSAAFVSALLLALPKIRWRRTTAMIYILLCMIVLAANIYSITGPQRTTMAIPWPKTIAQILRERTTTTPQHWLIRDLADGYFDWSDNSRVHDYLIVFRALQHARTSPDHKPVLVIDGSVTGCGTYGVLVTRFGQPFVWWGTGPSMHTEEISAIQKNLDSHIPVFLVTTSDQPNPIWRYLRYKPARASLDTAELFQVTGVRQAQASRF